LAQVSPPAWNDRHRARQRARRPTARPSPAVGWEGEAVAFACHGALLDLPGYTSTMRRHLALFSGLLLRGCAGRSTRPASDLTSGDIAGTVVDENHHTLPGATVELAGRGLGPRATTTDAQGTFRFRRIPRGRYRIEARLQGFRNWH